MQYRIVPNNGAHEPPMAEYRTPAQKQVWYTTPKRVEMYADAAGTVPVPTDYEDATQRPAVTGDLLTDTSISFSDEMLSGLPFIYLACVVIAYSLAMQARVLAARRTEYVWQVSFSMFTFFAAVFVVETFMKHAVRQLEWYAKTNVGTIDGSVALMNLGAWWLWRGLTLVRLNLFATAFCYMITTLMVSNVSGTAVLPDPTNYAMSLFDQRVYRQNMTGAKYTGGSEFTWSSGPYDQPVLWAHINDIYQPTESFVGKLAWGVEYLAFLYTDNLLREQGATLTTFTAPFVLVPAAKVVNAVTTFTFVDIMFQRTMTAAVPPPGDQHFYTKNSAQEFDTTGIPGGIGQGQYDEKTKAITTFARSSVIFGYRYGWMQVVRGMKDTGTEDPVSGQTFGFGASGALLERTAIMRAWKQSRGLFYSTFHNLPHNGLSTQEKNQLLHDPAFLDKNEPGPGFNAIWKTDTQALVKWFHDSFMTYENFNANRATLLLAGFDLTYFDKDISKGATGSITIDIANTMVGIAKIRLEYYDNTFEDQPTMGDPEVWPKVINSAQSVIDPDCGSEMERTLAICKPNLTGLAGKRVTFDQTSYTVHMTGTRSV